ncbi:hypothetical protein SAMN04487851_11469 [Prevotella sp. tc2-28]|nr:hypothetical protein SAMN04487851_11469 [Prevotella sp. tc2-28]
MKRLVRLKDKETKEIYSYSSITELIRRNGEEALGISLQSLYNAMSTNKGRWGNDRYEVYYETIELGNKEWR